MKTNLLPEEIDALAERVVAENKEAGRKVVLAESCTGGLMAKQLTDVPACVWAMAVGALRNSGADVAVAISGVAGPDGGTQLKPVGTVVFARAFRNQDGEPEGELKHFDGGDGPGGRASIRRQATLCALELLLP